MKRKMEKICLGTIWRREFSIYNLNLHYQKFGIFQPWGCDYNVNIIFRDYRPMPALDTYDAEEMDDEDYDELSIGDRRAAEREMDRRDGTRGFQTGFDHLLYCNYYRYFIR